MTLAVARTVRLLVRLHRLSGRQLRTTLDKLQAWCSFHSLRFEAKEGKNDGSKGAIHVPFQFLVLCRHVILDQLFLRHRKEGFVFVRRSILGTGQGHSSSPRPSLSTLPFSPFTVSFRTEGSVLGPFRLTLVGFIFHASWILLSFFLHFSSRFDRRVWTCCAAFLCASGVFEGERDTFASCRCCWNHVRLLKVSTCV